MDRIESLKIFRRWSVFFLFGLLFFFPDLSRVFGRDFKSSDIRRLGVFPGSFDPVHNGHLSLAQLACRRLNLDLLLFVPNSTNPKKPDMTPLEWRFKLLERAVKDLGDTRLKVLPEDSIRKATEEGDPNDAPQRIVLAAMKTAPNAKIFHILGSDSLEKILSNNYMPKPGDRRIIAVQPRGGEPPLPRKLLGPYIRQGVLTVLNPTSLQMSSTEVREAAKACDLDILASRLTSSNFQSIVLNGSYGMASNPNWLDSILKCSKMISQNREVSKNDSLLVPVTLPEKREISEFYFDFPDRGIGNIDFSERHSFGGLREFLRDGFSPVGFKILSLPFVEVEVFHGSRAPLFEYISSFASRTVEIPSKREFSTGGLFLCPKGNGKWKAISGGAFGNFRSLQNQIQIAEVLRSVGRNPLDFKVVREKK